MAALGLVKARASPYNRIMWRTIFLSAALAAVLVPLPARSQLTRTSENPPAKTITTGDYLLGCTPDQQKTVSGAAVLASKLLYKRVEGLKAELKVMQGPPAALAGAAMQAALKKHFRVPPSVGNHKAIMEKLVEVYETMYDHLVDPLHWPKLSCEDEQKQCEPGKYGYTLAMQGSSTYLCPEFFAAKDARIRADTLIHEMAHRQVPTSPDDFNEKGYYPYTGATPLGQADSLKNSDSYSHFVTDK